MQSALAASKPHARTTPRSFAISPATSSEGEGASHFVPLNPYLPYFEGTDPAADSAARAAFWSDVLEALGPAI